MLMTKAYAKINLGLNIVNKDHHDSYHNLDMVMVPIELHDRIEIEILPQGIDTLITSDDRNVPTDETNIVAKVEKALKDKVGYDVKFRIHIHKIIPMGAGLGGGSADGAAVLLGINKLLKLKLTTEELCEIAEPIGSDIPFCIRQIASRVEGKGNTITPLKMKKKYGCLILCPKRGLSTKEVYQKYDEVGTKDHADIAGIIRALENDNFDDLVKTMGNELYEAAKTIYPRLETLKKEMNKAGLDNVLMSGSGSCLFALSRDKKLLKRAYGELVAKGHKVILTSTK